MFYFYASPIHPDVLKKAPFYPTDGVKKVRAKPKKNNSTKLSTEVELEKKGAQTVVQPRTNAYVSIANRLKNTKVGFQARAVEVVQHVVMVTRVDEERQRRLWPKLRKLQPLRSLYSLRSYF